MSIKRNRTKRIKLGTKWQDYDRLFGKWDGRPMNNNTPYFWLKEFCEENNFRFCDILSLRHLHASLLIFKGVDVVAVSADMGHSLVGTTLNLYSHMFQEARARNCDAICNALKFANKIDITTKSPAAENSESEAVLGA